MTPHHRSIFHDWSHCMAVLCGMPTLQYSARSARLSVRLSKWAWPKRTSGQNNLAQDASPPQTDGSIVFARWRQCFLPWRHIGATWRIRLNACFLGLSVSTTQTINRSVEPFLHMSRQKVPVLYAQNCPFPWGIWTPSNTWFLWPIWAHHPNGTSIGSSLFAQMIAEGLYTLQWFAFPSKLSLLMRDLNSGPI